MSRHGPEHVAQAVGKTVNWVKRNAARYPHHKAGRTYFWTDDDVADILRAMEGGRSRTSEDGSLRPITGQRRSA